MDKDTHVYCTQCKHFRPIDNCDLECEDCYCKDCNCLDLEDSLPFSERPLYEINMKICFDKTECDKQIPCCNCPEIKLFQPLEEDIGCNCDCDHCFTPIC